MLVKTQGIVFRSIKYSETSLICDIYTLDLGLRSYIFSGVRKAKAKVGAGLLQPMSLLDLVVYNREGKDLNRVKEIKVLHPYREIPFDVRKSTLGVFLIEVARKSIREAESNPPLFRFLVERFIALDQAEGGLSIFHIHAMLGLSRFLGFTPGGEYQQGISIFDLREGLYQENGIGDPVYEMNAEESELMYKISNLEDEDLASFRADPVLRNALLDKLLSYFRYHVDRFGEMRSLEILRTIMR